MCQENRFACLQDDARTFFTQKDLVEHMNSKTEMKPILLAARPGFSLVLSRRNRRKIKRGEMLINSEAELRNEAFSTLSDRSKISAKLKRTEMCEYVLRGEKCPRKDCWFAHSHQELRITPCFFGQACRYIDDRSKPCRYLHPQETVEGYRLRIKNLPVKNDVPVLG